MVGSDDVCFQSGPFLGRHSFIFGAGVFGRWGDVWPVGAIGFMYVVGIYCVSLHLLHKHQPFIPRHPVIFSDDDWCVQSPFPFSEGNWIPRACR